MANKVYLDSSDNMMFVDAIQTTARSLDSIVKGDNSAHKARHQNAGADEISVAGLSGEPADTVNKTGAQTIAGVKTFSDSPKMDAIAEKTADTGITVDGILIKDDLDTSGIVAKTGAQTVAGVKTLSDNLVFSGDKTIQTNVKARAYLSANQLNLVSGTWTKVLLDTESYDVGADFASYKFTAPVTGYYLITGAIKLQSVVADKRYILAIYKNNSSIARTETHSALTEDLSLKVSDIVLLTANDYIELFVDSLAGVDTVDIYGNSGTTYLVIHLLSV